MGSVFVYTAIGNIPDSAFGIFSIPHQPSSFPQIRQLCVNRLDEPSAAAADKADRHPICDLRLVTCKMVDSQTNRTDVS
jgi:hypothetical protein